MPAEEGRAVFFPHGDQVVHALIDALRGRLINRSSLRILVRLQVTKRDTVGSLEDLLVCPLRIGVCSHGMLHGGSTNGVDVYGTSAALEATMFTLCLNLDLGEGMLYEEQS